jgi:hypothetical protein
MTARFSVTNSHIEDDLILVLKKKTDTYSVKVITVRLKIHNGCGSENTQRRVTRSPKHTTLSLTEITLTVRVIYTTVFEYKNQVTFNMTIFDGGPRCQIDTCF